MYANCISEVEQFLTSFRLYDILTLKKITVHFYETFIVLFICNVSVIKFADD